MRKKKEGKVELYKKYLSTKQEKLLKKQTQGRHGRGAKISKGYSCKRQEYFWKYKKLKGWCRRDLATM